MSSQVKITDYFVSLKSQTSAKSSVSLRSGTKKSVDTVTSDLLTSNHTSLNTPKRKLIAKSSESSSKRRKTPRNCNNDKIKVYDKNETKTSDELPKSLPSPQKSKQLTAEEVKEKLGKCSNLTALRERLAAINDCADKVKKFKEMKIASPVKISSTPLKCKSSPPVKAYSTPKKSPTKSTDKHEIFSPNYRRRLFDIYEESASTPNKDDDTERVYEFERFSHLTLKQSLSLPHKYKVLAEAFRCADYVVSMLAKRHEMCTFDKLKQSVEAMMRKTFDIKRLAQIQTVFSDAFVLEYENNKLNPQLTITANYGTTSGVSQLLLRYHSFTDKLLNITKEHHNRFLNSLSVPISIDSTQLCRWHPKFKLDEVPDIVTNDNSLPTQPSKSNGESAEGLLGITKIEDKNDSVVNNNAIDNIMSPTKITKGVLKGLSTDLLNKIRAKEAVILTKEMTRKPEIEKQLLMMKRLPEFIRIIHAYYISEKKLAIPYDELINKIIVSYHTCLSIIETKEHLDYLIKLLPDWIFVVIVNRSSYIKIEKNKSILELIQIITKHATFLRTN